MLPSVFFPGFLSPGLTSRILPPPPGFAILLLETLKPCNGHAKVYSMTQVSGIRYDSDSSEWFLWVPEVPSPSALHLP